ncbi:(2S)-3-sulfopropanediol dehydratase activating enzyme [Desulforamulus ferrireducens]|uniref:Pyruvate formate lyase-activating protein n=1 Tax=Desulforamulus ferrireducens TaxID=1833852 RepID=A0A1S6ISZ6_9FIRM|nr:glycyl-radical enzyme activating protein [Desulforamulus ferrireducens]AQS57886.1 pyruvate formate lyase-activating protein [Desulforamulus ferrireducens]
MTEANTPKTKKDGIVFNIQRYSVHDGPGIRTIVFLKGCPLRCQWCANPESQQRQPELAYNDNKCIGTEECFYCFKACPVGAIQKKAEKIQVDRELCTNCGSCAASCPSQALNMYGKSMSAKEVLDTVEQDSIFYSRSGGGMTLSGGEPLSQADFATELLKEAKRRRINTTIETCGYADWEKLEQVCAYVDNILYDIKSMHPVKHQAFTGVSNERILENLKKLYSSFPNKAITVRTPVIPGFNDTEQDILAILDFIADMPGVHYELLGYHRLGEPKYNYLGKDYLLSGIMPLAQNRLAALKQLVQEHFNSR